MRVGLSLCNYSLSYPRAISLLVRINIVFINDINKRIRYIQYLANYHNTCIHCLVSTLTDLTSPMSHTAFYIAGGLT